VSELQIFRCVGCGVHLFPERLRCARCGAREFEAVAAGPGRVEERTTLRRQGVSLGSVRLASGPVVIARLGEDTEDEVRLEEHPDGAIEARGGQ
jgi:uncharacterized OB-fold protein